MKRKLKPKVDLAERVARKLVRLKKIQTYKHGRGCPKCGRHDTSNAFRSKGKRLDYEWGNFETAKIDLIRRYCRNCGYSWNEKPLES